MRDLPHLILRLLVLLLVAACEKHEHSPKEGERRVVVLSPAAGVVFKEMLELGLVHSQEIVGRHAFDIALDDRLPVCGDQHSPDYEALLNARPTDIVIQWGRRDLPSKFARLAESRNWRVTNFDPLSLDEVIDAVAELELKFGNQQDQPSVLRGEMDRAFAPRGDFRRAGRIMLLADTRPIEALGPGSAHQQVLERIGGTPAITRGASYRAMEAEDVLNEAPDGIILVMPRPKGSAREDISPSRRREMLGKIGELAIPAVLTGRVAMIDDPRVLMPSSYLIEFADELTKVLTEWSKER